MEGKEMKIKVGIKVKINLLELQNEQEQQEYLKYLTECSAHHFGKEAFRYFGISVKHPTEKQIKLACLGKGVSQKREHEHVSSLNVFSDEQVERLLQICEELDIKSLSEEMRDILQPKIKKNEPA